MISPRRETAGVQSIEAGGGMSGRPAAEGHDAMNEYANWLARLVDAAQMEDSDSVQLYAETLKALYCNALIVQKSTIDKEGS